MEEATAIIRDEWRTYYKPAAPGVAPAAPADAAAGPVASGSNQPAPGHRSAQAASHAPVSTQYHLL